MRRHNNNKTVGHKFFYWLHSTFIRRYVFSDPIYSSETAAIDPDIMTITPSIIFFFQYLTSEEWQDRLAGSEWMYQVHNAPRSAHVNGTDCSDPAGCQCGNHNNINVSIYRFFFFLSFFAEIDFYQGSNFHNGRLVFLFQTNFLTGPSSDLQT